MTDGKADVSTLGLKAVDDKTLEITTNAPKPYLPGVVCLWYPVPKHQFDKFGDDWSTNVENVVSSGPFMLKSWEKSNNSVVLTKNETYTGPWPAEVDELTIDPSVGLPEVGMPAFLAGDLAFTYLNAGQIPVVKQRFPDSIRTNAVFATSYISFDLESRAVRQCRRPPGLLLRRQPRRTDLDRAQGHRHPGRLDPGARLSWVQREHRRAGRVRSRQGQGIHGQGRLSERRRLPGSRDLVPRRRRL